MHESGCFDISDDLNTHTPSPRSVVSQTSHRLPASAPDAQTPPSKCQNRFQPKQYMRKQLLKI